MSFRGAPTAPSQCEGLKTDHLLLYDLAAEILPIENATISLNSVGYALIMSMSHIELYLYSVE